MRNIDVQQDVLDALKSRRSVRKFKKKQVAEEELALVLEAGTYAPTSGGRQDPVIVAVRDPKMVCKVNALNSRILGMDAIPNPYYGAPTILLVLAPLDGHAPKVDASLVAGNLMNAAYAVGLGSCYIHRCHEMFETAEGKELLKEWGISENMQGVCSIALGYTDGDIPAASDRKEHYIVSI